MYDFLLRRSLEEHKPISIIYMSSNGIIKLNIKVIKINGDKVEA